MRNTGPGYAGVAATLALVASLGIGGAYAAGKIGGKQIKPSAVKSKHIGDGQVRAADIGPHAVQAGAIAPQSVDGISVVDESLIGANVADGTLGGRELAEASLSSREIGRDAVGPSELAAGSVGSSELKGLAPAVSSGVTVSPGQTRTTAATCPSASVAIAGGYAWRDHEVNSMIASTPNETDGRQWYATGHVPASAGSDNALFAWATCLPI